MEGFEWFILLFGVEVLCRGQVEWISGRCIIYEGEYWRQRRGIWKGNNLGTYPGNNKLARAGMPHFSSGNGGPGRPVWSSRGAVAWAESVRAVLVALQID